MQLQLLLIFFILGSSSALGCYNTDCQCTEDLVQMRCNRASINFVVSTLRALGDSVVSSITLFTFVAPPETVLLAETFTNFTSLRSLTICCSNLFRIEPGAFNTLSQLVLLDLRINHLEFLSAQSLTGIGPQLGTLQLGDNRFVNLQSDLLSTFSSVSTLLELRDNTNFTCDCHLQWLVDFVNSANLMSTQTVNMRCLQPSQETGKLITDPTVDFNSMACTDVCSRGYHSCSPHASCIASGNSSTGVSCSCNRGYFGNGYSCYLTDPCVLVSCHSNATCSSDTQGNTSCTCAEGYTGDGYECIEIDPCAIRCHANATCMVDGRSQATCMCDLDFTGDGLECHPLDPCRNTQCHANATCISDGNDNSGNCVCNNGYSGDGQLCTLLDPCTSMRCHGNATCRSSGSSTAMCICNDGFVDDGQSCRGICETVQCHFNAFCIPNEAIRTGICVCDEGYSGNGYSCSLINPCLSCHANATCDLTGAPLSPLCVCNAGYTGNGFSCFPVNPCSSCHSNATCDLNTSPICACNTGYTGNGFSCFPVNPCSSCHSNATCDLNTSPICACNAGYTGNGFSCFPVNPCSSCHSNATCDLNTSPICACNAGYTGNGFSCFPVNPCSSCHANATCELSSAPPSPICVCKIGYTGSGTFCSLVDYCSSLTCGQNAYCEPISSEGRGICRCLENHLGDPLSNCTPRELCDLSCGELGVVCVGGEGGEGTMCVSVPVKNLRQQLNGLASGGEVSEEALVMFTASLLESAANSSRPEDLPAFIALFQDTLQYLDNPSPATVQNLVELGSELLDTNKISVWQDLGQTEATMAIGQLLTSLQMVGHAIFLSINSTGKIVYSSSNVALVVVRPNCTALEDTVVSSNLLSASNASGTFSLPVSVFGSREECATSGLVVVVYDGIGPLLSSDQLLPKNSNCLYYEPQLAHGQCRWYNNTPSCSNQSVEGVVFSASVISANASSVGGQGDGGVRTVNTSLLLEPVRITFKHEPRPQDSDPPACGFLNEQQLGLGGETWLTENCQAVLDESSDTRTVCECYHLTSFALLVSPTMDRTESKPLQIVSKVGLCISIICLLITIILLFSLKLETRHLHQIHRQLAIALCLAQLLFLVGVDRRLVRSPDALCTTFAVLLHYFFLCAFAWQLVEGVHLYLLVVKVFFNKKVVWLYYPLSWGIPAVVVAITVGVKFCDYGSEDFCWITGDNGTNWAFNGPILAVLVVNLVIMIIITVILVRAARTNEKDTCLLCTLVHASLVLLPILGVGWVLGFLVVGEGAIFDVIEWLFSIFATLQGTMIFFMHCVLNKDVRKAFLKAIGCHEAAKKQATVHDMRRTSMAYIRRKSSVGLESTKNMRLFPRKKSHTMDSSMTEESTDFGFTAGTGGGRPSITAMSVDLEPLRNISEEDGSGYSLPNSVPGTPETGSRHDMAEVCSQQEASVNNSDSSTHQLINQLEH